MYAYDLRDRMTSAAAGESTTTYGYGTGGVRVSTATDDPESATYYLNDPHNPTGYTKAIQESAALAGAPKRSYVLGLKVEAQADPGAQTNDPPVVVYFLTDGHGSTRALTDADGAIALKDSTAQIFDYDAFGKALDFDAGAALTAWLFAGDGRYDAATGWSYQLARWRNGFWFTQADPSRTDSTQDPISLHKYLYANANPIMISDPRGLFSVLDFCVAHSMITSIISLSVVSGIMNGFASAFLPEENFASGFFKGFIAVGVRLSLQCAKVPGPLAAGLGSLAANMLVDGLVRGRAKANPARFVSNLVLSCAASMLLDWGLSPFFHTNSLNDVEAIIRDRAVTHLEGLVQQFVVASTRYGIVASVSVWVSFLTGLMFGSYHVSGKVAAMYGIQPPSYAFVEQGPQEEV